MRFPLAMEWRQHQENRMLCRYTNSWSVSRWKVWKLTSNSGGGLGLKGNEGSCLLRSVFQVLHLFKFGTRQAEVASVQHTSFRSFEKKPARATKLTNVDCNGDDKPNQYYIQWQHTWQSPDNALQATESHLICNPEILKKETCMNLTQNCFTEQIVKWALHPSIFVMVVRLIHVWCSRLEQSVRN